MDIKNVNPFIESFEIVMPQLGFSKVQRGNVTIKGRELISSGITIIVGIVGAIKGNVVYTIGIEDAKKIASTMMMGMPVDEIDDMSKSALSELSNMLTANAATCFSNIGILIDISTPTLLQGNNISVDMSSDQVLCLQILVDEITMEVNLALK